METLIFQTLCLLARKKIIVHFSYLFGTIAFITFTFSTANRLQAIPSRIPVIQLNGTIKLTSTTNQYEEKRDFFPDKCIDTNNQLLFRSLQTSNILNHLGFVLRSQSLFYCSVPKVATRTLLTYITYIHVRDELISSLKNTSMSFDTNYFYTMFANSIQNDSLSSSSSLLSHFLSAIKSNGSKIDLWSMYQQKALPYIRPQTLTDPSILFSPSFTRAIFVRHPLERLASAYADKIGTLKSEPFSLYDSLRQQICRQFASSYLKLVERRHFHRFAHSPSNQLNEPCAKVIPTFEHFIDYIMHDSLQDDVHWQPYSSLCKACQMKYNFIGRYETIEEDLKRLQNKLGLNTSDWNFKNEFSTGKTKENYKSLYSKLSKDLLCNLKDFYRNDLKLFNYRFEDYLPDQQELQCPTRFYRRFHIPRP